VFGPEDQLFNRFATMAQRLLVMPVVAGATRFQPVYVGDVADAVIAGLTRADAVGATYELGGPLVLSMRELLTYVLAQTGRHRRLVTVPLGLARLQAAVLEAAARQAADPRPASDAAARQCGGGRRRRAGGTGYRPDADGPCRAGVSAAVSSGW